MTSFLGCPLTVRMHGLLLQPLGRPSRRYLILMPFSLAFNEPDEPPPDGPSGWASPAASTLDPTLSPASIVDLACPLTMLPRPDGLRSSPQQMLDRIQLQDVPSYVTLSNGAQERRNSELVSQSRLALNGQAYDLTVET
jgi:hypothetical protein